MKKWFTKISILLICAVIFGMGEVSFAQDTDVTKISPNKPIVVDGDEVEYFEEEGRIVATGNVIIVYGDIKLSCEKIEVDTKRRRALCEGNVRIERPEGLLTGEYIEYDFNEQKGGIDTGEVQAFPWFGRADETGKVAENEFLLHKGYVTTCDLDKPHYRVQAEEIRVFPNEKVIAKNVVIYIGEVPVLWLPYYYHPIIDWRAKVQFIPGHSSDWGYFLLSAWRFYVKGNSKVDILVDYRTKKGFAEGANLYYNTDDFFLPGLGEGALRSYFVHQNGAGIAEKRTFRDRGTEEILRSRLQWKHRIDFEPGTTGMLEFNKLSDEDLIKDYFYNEYEENTVEPPNYVSLISSKRNYTFSVEANKQFNDFYTVVQRLPEVKVDVPNQRLWETPLYYSATTSGVVFEKVYRKTSNGGASPYFLTTAEPTERVNRFDTYHKLSCITGVGPLKLTPYGTLRETMYNRTVEGYSPVNRNILGGGLDAFIRFYRTFDVETDVLGLDINKMRHIFSPGAKYFYTQKPTAPWTDFYQMDSVDSLDKSNGVTLLLENKLQTKHSGGENVRATDLARFIVSTDYMFHPENDWADETDGFKKLKFDLEFIPYDWLFLDSEMIVTPDNQAINTGNIEVVTSPADSFQMTMGYRYEKKVPLPRNQYTFDISYILNPKWRVGVYERFNFQGRDVEEQQFSITRDLHCWEMDLIYNVEGSRFFKDKFSVWVAFRIKAFPDLQLGLSRSFQKRRPGSLHPGSSQGTS